MGQIVFMCPFKPNLISGGIKSTYYVAELLTELGFDARVLQPAGPPVWLHPRLHVLVTAELDPTPNDILVFPETLTDWLGKAARAKSPARKVLFCRNQYHMVTYRITAQGYERYGFSHFIVPSEIAKQMLQSVFGLPNVSVVPNHVRSDLFYPRPKEPRIVTVPRKWSSRAGYPGHAELLKTIMALKYPHLRSVPWDLLEDKSEEDVAEIMGRSSVFLSLAYMECCPLTPLEAMASGCIVVGYHGSGGLEYATPENGLWLSPEYLEEIADELAAALQGAQRGDPKYYRLREGGLATAARFNRERTKRELGRVFDMLCSTTPNDAKRGSTRQRLDVPAPAS